MKQQKIRQICFSLCVVLLVITNVIYAQKDKHVLSIDYSTKSNLLNPDTLRGDQKKIFWHFVKLSSKELENLDPQNVKAEFEILGIYTDERERFVAAYSFLLTYYQGHKVSCENISEIMEDLGPQQE